MADKYTGEKFKLLLANVLEDRAARIRKIVDEEQACSSADLSKFIWTTGKRVYEVIAPEKGMKDTPRHEAWQHARGMLKALIDFNLFTPVQYHAPCVNNVLEKQVAEVIERYKTFVVTGEVQTKQLAPKLLGETDEILCVDKPCHYTCSYGDRGPAMKPPDRALKKSGEKATASMLLNGDKAGIQLHEYLALKFNYENAVGTREFWKSEPVKMTCNCGQCSYCACTQAGCCNRLDKETSGVMICAKTKVGFGEVRKQFQSVHTVEEGGTEKYYIALVHGEVALPTVPVVKSTTWKHEPSQSKKQGKRGRVEISLYFQTTTWKSVPWDDGTGEKEWHKSGGVDDGDDAKGGKQYALTFYKPVAWFKNHEGNKHYTLIHLQIITGRTHQIRFHMSEVGHPLVGDTTYGAPFSDRSWSPRVFLHSYQTIFREPFTERWFEATSPVPQDLGDIIETNLEVTRANATEEKLSRRKHEQLKNILKQYDPSQPLLWHFIPEGEAATASAAAAPDGQDAGAGKKLDPATGAELNKFGFPIRPGAKLCDFWCKTSNCKFGKTCKFDHPDDRKTPSPAPQPAQQEQDNWQGADEGWKKPDARKTESEWTSHEGSAWQAGGAGGTGWEAKGDGGWQDGVAWKSDSGGRGWDQGSQQAAAPAPAPAATQADGEDDDEQWGSWVPDEPPLKKPRVDAAPTPAPAPAAAVPAVAPAAPAPATKAVFATAAPATPPEAKGAQAPATGWKRMESRSSRGTFYYWNPTTNETLVDPPAPWKKMESRSQPGTFYYWNPQTGVTSPQKPEV